MYPNSAIYVEGCSPDSCAAEQIIAEKFAYITRVILEPLEVEFPDALDVVFAVLVELFEVNAEVAVLPVCAISNVLTIILVSLWPAARGVSAKADS